MAATGSPIDLAHAPLLRVTVLRGARARAKARQIPQAGVGAPRVPGPRGGRGAHDARVSAARRAGLANSCRSGTCRNRPGPLGELPASWDRRFSCARHKEPPCSRNGRAARNGAPIWCGTCDDGLHGDAAIWKEPPDCAELLRSACRGRACGFYGIAPGCRAEAVPPVDLERCEVLPPTPVCLFTFLRGPGMRAGRRPIRRSSGGSARLTAAGFALDLVRHGPLRARGEDSLDPRGWSGGPRTAALSRPGCRIGMVSPRPISWPCASGGFLTCSAVARRRDRLWGGWRTPPVGQGPDDEITRVASGSGWHGRSW